MTDSQCFYISVSLDEIKVDEKPYFAISAFSPLYQAMAQSRVNDTFSFRGRPYRIEEAF